MPVYVYFIGCVNVVTKTLTAIKIGKSENPQQRLTDFKVGNPNDLVILKTVPCENQEEAERLEKSLHATYRNNQLNGEWFSITIELLTDIYLNESDIPLPEETRIIAHKQRIEQRIISVLEDNPNISAKTIQNRMRWAELAEVRAALKRLLRREAIQSEKPNRTLLYSIKEKQRDFF